MSKMDRQLNSKKDKETIYEIYRACRLCGAGAGYKMPIIQSVVDVDDTEVELKQKVRECVQIEVHQDDKMPPLICELCVDKVNDFYEFLEMCRQTNKRTRLRLGLPPQSLPKGVPDAGECILGLTEPVYVNEDSDGEPLSKQKKLIPKVKVKREPELKVRLENKILTETRTTRNTKRSPTPPRVTRHRTSSKEDVTPSRLKDKPKSSPKTTPKSILKKETKNEDNSPLTPRLKRSRDKEPAKPDTPIKRVKIPIKPVQPAPKTSPLSSPRNKAKTVKISPKRPPSPPPRLYKCAICGQANKSAQANMCHMRSHTVGYTSLRLACNPCGLWFPTPEEATAHHKAHRNKSKPYQCRFCEERFKQLTAYDEHFEENQCTPFNEVPDVKCSVCWRLFATNKLLEDHKCLGEDNRPGGKCGKCKRNYTLLKNLKKHEQTCTAKKKGELIVDPVLLGKLKPIQIRVSRCDPLLTNLKQEHYDVSSVTADFGLDKNCVYPYISSYSRLRIKSDPDGMVDINAEIKDEFHIQEDYIHWDSEETDSEEEGSSSPSLVLGSFEKKKKIDSLANLTLKTLFSKRCLGKVPKKKRRVKNEKMFDSLLGGTEDDVTRDINNIIENLTDDDDEFDGGSQKGDESLKVDDESQKADGESQKMDDESQKTDDENQKDDSKNLSDADKSMDVSDDKVNVSSDKDISNVDENDKSNDNVSLTDNNDSLEKTEQNAQNNDKLSDKNDGNLSEEKDRSATKNFNSDENNDSNGSNNNISKNNDNNRRVEDKVNNGINSFSFDYFDGDVVSKPESESQNDDQKIDFKNSQDSSSIGGVSESLLNENTQSDVTSLTDKETNDKVTNDIDNATSLAEKNSDVDHKSQSNDNLSQDSEMPESEIKTNDSSQREEQSDGQNQNESESQNDSEGQNQKTDNVTETDYKNAISVIVNCGKNKMATDSEEMDDSKLMEALDAQIGNSNEKSNSKNQGNDNFNDNALEDLVSAKNNDMGSYQDFNFDA